MSPFDEQDHGEQSNFPRPPGRNIPSPGPFGETGHPPPGWSGPPVAPGRDPGAVRSLVLGIIGLLCCPIIFSVGAIYEGTQCRKRIRQSDGRLEGDDLALVGLILGVIGLALMPVWFLLVY
jgi:hypothetical protein